MSIFKYMFDTDYFQRRDFEAYREQEYRDAIKRIGAPSGIPSKNSVKELANEVKELAATVHVLMQMLAEKGGLDLAEVERRVDDELKPKVKERPVKPPKPLGPLTDEVCTKCSAAGTSHDMVRVGNAWFCRPCARNP